MSRGGKAKDRDEPERRCIASGKSGPKSGLIRFVVGPDAQIVPDLAENLPGRGIWVSTQGKALEKAIGKSLFSRSARQKVQVPGDLAELVERLLVSRITNLLGLARKAGQAIAGKQKVLDLLIAEEASVLLQASDGSKREMGELRPPPGEDRFFNDLTASELGLAFGRDRVIHAALIAGGLERSLRYESARLRGLRSNQG